VRQGQPSKTCDRVLTLTRRGLAYELHMVGAPLGAGAPIPTPIGARRAPRGPAPLLEASVPPGQFSRPAISCN